MTLQSVMYTTATAEVAPKVAKLGIQNFACSSCFFPNGIPISGKPAPPELFLIWATVPAGLLRREDAIRPEAFILSKPLSPKEGLDAGNISD